jgi:hypothetical protein
MRKARKVRRAKTGKRRLAGTMSGNVRQALSRLRTQGRTVRVVGGVVNGKVVLDRGQLSAVAKIPDCRIAFVALNAPFKTRALTGAR